MKLLITRPRHDADELAERLSSMGIESVICPLMNIKEKSFEITEPTQYQAILVTSSNGLKILQSNQILKKLSSIPVYAVGNMSQEAAKKAGFITTFSADGDLHALSELIVSELDPENGPLLYLSGEIISGDLRELLASEGYEVDRVEVYVAKRTVAFSQDITDALGAGEIDGVTLYSKRSAQIFAELMVKHNVNLPGTFYVFCLSEAVASSFMIRAEKIKGHSDLMIQASQFPNQASLVDLISEYVT